MDLSQQSITGHEFELNRRGYDPDVVDAHLAKVADAVAEQTRRFAELEMSVEGLQAKVRDADESEEALRLTLKAAAHAKEELLSNAREQAKVIEAEAAGKAESVVGEAETKARTLVDEAEGAAAQRSSAAESYAKSLEDGARLRAGEVAKAALAESEALVARIEDLRSRLEVAESALSDLQTGTNPGLLTAKEAVEDALAKAREAAANPDILAAVAATADIPAVAPLPEETASAPEAIHYEEPAAEPVADHQPAPESQDDSVAESSEQPPGEHVEAAVEAERELSPEPVDGTIGEENAESTGEEIVAEAEEVAAEPSQPDSVEAPPESTSHPEPDPPAPTEAPHLEIVEAGESTADISDKVDRLLEELREVT